MAAGLWAYWNAKTFEDGLLSVVRAGGDADTNAAVACAILGAKFGFNSIPKEYVGGLIYKEQLEEVISGMTELAKLISENEARCNQTNVDRYHEVKPS
jgi:ADP-ribosylglycohydrolase